jgi:hypothetical protein
MSEPIRDKSSSPGITEIILWCNLLLLLQGLREPTVDRQQINQLPYRRKSFLDACQATLLDVLGLNDRVKLERVWQDLLSKRSLLNTDLTHIQLANIELSFSGSYADAEQTRSALAASFITHYYGLPA